jgi:hypothetical protein
MFSFSHLYEEAKVKEIASLIHEEWRKDFQATKGQYTERIKDCSDGTTCNINQPFNKLHYDWQRENLASARSALYAINLYPKNRAYAADHVHEGWMVRNPKCDYNKEQHVPYDNLPLKEQQKDLLVVDIAQRVHDKYKFRYF